VGPRAVLDAVVKRKIPSPRRESNPRIPKNQENQEGIELFNFWSMPMMLIYWVKISTINNKNKQNSSIRR
jgi:hypothetical protein